MDVVDNKTQEGSVWEPKRTKKILSISSQPELLMHF